MKSIFANPRRVLTEMALLIAVGTAAFSLSGCATSPVARKTIEIESNPTGVRVEVNGEDLGKTPTSYTLRPNKKGDFNGGWGDSPSVVFTAFPPEGVDGLFKQRKVFNPSSFMDRGDRVPGKIFFDLHEDPDRVNARPLN
jgi:hypothetical protein